MGLFDDLTADVAAIAEADGEQVKITTATQTCYVRGFWEAESLVGGEQGGPFVWIAFADMPADMAMGDSLTYDGNTYRIEHRADDGHGLQRLTLV